MAAFVTVAELEAYLQRDLDDAAATEALDAACQAIRDYLGQQLDYVQNEVVRLHGTGRRTILLPELPVNAVDAVSIDEDGVTTALVAGDWWVDGASGVLFRVGTNGIRWPGGVANVTVTYDHGYMVVPASIASVAMSLASRLYHAATFTPGMRSEQLGASSYVRDDTATNGLVGLEKQTLDRYAQRRIPVA